MPLFVYGTLRDPDVLRAVLGHPLGRDRLQPATALGCRVVFFPSRTYPALRAEPGAVAEGAIIDGLSGTDLALLDLFEGEEYSRRAIELIVNGRTVTADVYWPAPSIPAEAATWSLPNWVARHKAAFLAAEADGIAELRRRLTAIVPD